MCRGQSNRNIRLSRINSEENPLRCAQTVSQYYRGFLKRITVYCYSMYKFPKLLLCKCRKPNWFTTFLAKITGHSKGKGVLIYLWPTLLYIYRVRFAKNIPSHICFGLTTKLTPPRHLYACHTESRAELDLFMLDVHPVTRISVLSDRLNAGWCHSFWASCSGIV